MNKFPLISVLKNPLYASIGFAVALVFFSLHYYLMAALPGSANFQCKIGANLTAGNIFFALLLSLMAGWCVAGLMALLKKPAAASAGGTALAGAGALTGILTTFCTLCTLPAITLLGASIGFGFFTDYNIYFKILSIVLMAIALHSINRSLNRQCSFCHFKPLNHEK